MNTYWMIRTHGDPLGSIQKLIREVWAWAKLDSMLLPSNGGEEKNERSLFVLAQPRLVHDPAALEHVNPFKPLMTMNAARLIPDLLKENAAANLGALLRPCEMRALIEMAKRTSTSTNGFKLGRLLTICVDCLGTVPADEYQWRAARKGAVGKLADETLQFARQGGIADYRYRPACQTCTSPEASGADINIHILGLPVRQSLLVNVPEETNAALFQCDISHRWDISHCLDKITDGPAAPELLEQHTLVVERMAARHHHTMERINQSLGELLPQDVDALIEKLENCGDCQLCMNVCPICSVDFPYRDAQNHFKRQDIIRWLVSCSGCGMCEQSCSNKLPLNSIFGHIRSLLAEEYAYISGQSINELLPIIE